MIQVAQPMDECETHDILTHKKGAGEGLFPFDRQGRRIRKDAFA
jgi:hypothetical protein